jgi:hypothetical protein
MAMGRISEILLFLLPLLAAAADPEPARTCASEFADLPIEDQLKDSVPILEAGNIHNGETQRELMLRLLKGLPLPLDLPMNTEKLITVQARLGESRPGISSFWSSPVVLDQVLDLGGSFGPLSPIGFRMGPIGDTALSPSEYWQKAVDMGIWMTAPRNVFANFGPLNPYNGVLSSVGADASDWFQGDFDVLGTNSFAGPKGILGPLGPLGAVPSIGDVALDNSGFYVDQATHKLIRTITEPFGADKRNYEIMEKLKANFSTELSDKWLLNSSYMVDSHLTNENASQVFRSTAQDSELVSAIVVPDIGYTSNDKPIFPFFFPPPYKRLNFNLAVKDGDGNEIITSQLPNKANLVQFQVRKGQRFQLEVSTQGKTFTGRPQNFRLIVVPANSYYSAFVWMHVLGPEFESIWESNPKNIDLTLNYIFTKMMADSFADYKSLIKSGKSLENPTEFWVNVMKNAMAAYDGNKKSNQDLLNGIAANLASYQSTITDNPLSGEEMLGMWKNTMATTGTGKDAYFDLTAEKAAQIPKDWLNMEMDNLSKLRQTYGGTPAAASPGN